MGFRGVIQGCLGVLSLRSVCEWLSVRGCLVGLACMAAPRFASNFALRLGFKAWLKASVCEWLSVRGCLVGLACMAAPRFASNFALRLGLKVWLKA